MMIRNSFKRLENTENSRLPFFSVLEQDLEVGGHILPTGTVAVLCHMTMQHNPEVGNIFLDQELATTYSVNEQILKMTCFHLLFSLSTTPKCSCQKDG